MKIRTSSVSSAWQRVCSENRKQTAHFLADHSEDTHVTQQGKPSDPHTRDRLIRRVLLLEGAAHMVVLLAKTVS